MDEESTRGMVFLLEITNSWTRNPPEECLFRQELPAQGQGIPPKKGIPPGITSSFTLIQNSKIKMRGNSPRGNNTANANLKNLNTKTSLK
jgi:hypothetical protein